MTETKNMVGEKNPNKSTKGLQSKIIEAEQMIEVPQDVEKTMRKLVEKSERK